MIENERKKCTKLYWIYITNLNSNNSYEIKTLLKMNRKKIA